MGYEAPKKLYRLLFADEEMAGLEVKAVAPAMGEFLDIAQLAELANKAELTPADIHKVMPVFDLFIGCVRTWNLERDGVPVPVTVAGLLGEEMPFIMQMVDGWMRAVATVPTPLAKPSGDGATSPEASIPMEPLSQSRAS